MYKMIQFLYLSLFSYLAEANLSVVLSDIEDQKVELLTDIVISNIKDNGWNNIVIFGNFPNSLYIKLNILPFTFITSNTNEDDYYIEDVMPYHTNAILMRCHSLENFEESLPQVMNMPYWHPHANIYLYYHARETGEELARIFFIFWYYKASNVVLIQEDDERELIFVSNYTPFVSEVYDFGQKYGCWTARKIGIPIYTFEEGFVCEKNCHNVTQNSKLKGTNLGTCLGFVTHTFSYGERKEDQNLQLFEDKGKNFHGFAFRGYTTEVLPFMVIEELSNSTYELSSRDGNIWNNMAELLNFTIDLTPSVKVMKKPFDFEINIQQIFAVAHRKGDLFLNPIYQFDVIVVEIDYSFAYKDSGVCFMSHRAEFETNLFDLNMIIGNYDMIIKFGLSFLFIWLIFCLYSGIETRHINMDFFSKNFMNTVRSVLLINLSHPPKRTSFRIFLTFTIWSFFVINFSTQAAITSFFTALKRGREVNYFDDVIEKGYKIEGMASPDVVLPQTEEKFQKINSKLSPIRDIFGCIRELSNDSHRFCLIDCSVGRYLQRNKLDENGKQYLHIAQDRIHSYYLNFVFPKYSVITENFNKYLMIFFEAGLVKKWEAYRFADMKEETPVKALAIKDISGIFNVNFAFLIITIFVFFMELTVGNFHKLLLCMKLKIRCKTK